MGGERDGEVREGLGTGGDAGSVAVISKKERDPWNYELGSPDVPVDKRVRVKSGREREDKA